MSKFNYPVTEIVRVIDGDSIRVRIDRGFKDYSVRDVRLKGVDAPELSTGDAGRLVREIVAYWLSHCPYVRGEACLMVHSEELDKYGRILGDFEWYLKDDEGEWCAVGVTLVDTLLLGNVVEPYSGAKRETWPVKRLVKITEIAREWLGNATKQKTLPL